jgi:hypothetical protein
LVIAHRLSTIQYASRILVFHKGRLRPPGTPGSARHLLPPLSASIQRAGTRPAGRHARFRRPTRRSASWSTPRSSARIGLSAPPTAHATRSALNFRR